jgi:hypothetical protein
MAWINTTTEDAGFLPTGSRPQRHEDCRPFVKWVGGKTQLLSEIFHRLPNEEDIGTYHEPFLGGGAVFFALQPSKAFLTDVNPELINAFCVVRDSVEKLIHHLRRHPYDEEYYYQVRDIDRGPFMRHPLGLPPNPLKPAQSVVRKPSEKLCQKTLDIR